jgi:alpha-D-ribose 1-methylphosphonate 5-triphosphate synthase subunit PhnL
MTRIIPIPNNSSALPSCPNDDGSTLFDAVYSLISAMTMTPALFSHPARLPTDLPKQAVIHADQIHKTFTLHHQGGAQIPVLTGTTLTVQAGECVALQGPSGSGKSTFMRSLYANYRIDHGAIWVKHQGDWVNLPQLPAHQLLAVRQQTIGYVSQFLRVIPRVPALEVAADPLLDLGVDLESARDTIRQLFTQLNLPERLWHLSPTTFSGGEKQRVNIARAFAVNYPVLLLDEPTSALDAANRDVVMNLIEARKAQGCAMVGIFHDDEVRERVCDRTLHF